MILFSSTADIVCQWSLSNTEPSVVRRRPSSSVRRPSTFIEIAKAPPVFVRCF